jgi:hypothetical protein
MPIKRSTLQVFDPGELGLANSIAAFLRHQGLDAVVVSKHALQVHPQHEAMAREAVKQYKWGWQRSAGKRSEAAPRPSVGGGGKLGAGTPRGRA